MSITLISSTYVGMFSPAALCLPMRSFNAGLKLRVYKDIATKYN